MIEELGRRVRNEEITWREATKIYNEETRQNISINALKKRFYRLQKDEEQVNIGASTKEDYERERTTIFADGSIEAERIVNFPKEIKEDPKKVLEALGYNPERWKVSFMQFSNWQQNSKADGLVDLYAVKFKIVPEIKKAISLEEAMKVAKGVFKEEIKPFKLDNKYNQNTNKDLLIEFPAVELHLGKLAHYMETGENYDYKIASAIFREIVDEVLAMQVLSGADNLFLSIGNDFFNTDTVEYTTTKGTPQANDLRWQKMFLVGLELYKETILKLREQFNNIDINLVSGNHDEMSSFYLYIALEQFFSEDKKVNFIEDYKKVQAYQFGDCAIFTAHGEKNLNRLIRSIPAEFYEVWGKSKYRELHLGHLHKEVVVDDESGLITRRIGSPSGTDKWHYEERYIGATKKHQIFLWHRNKGLLVIKNIPFDPTKKKDEKQKRLIR